MCHLISASKPHRRTGLVIALALAGGFAASIPTASLAATAYFTDPFDQPNSPTSANDTAYNGESVLGGTIDTGLGPADRWLYFRLNTSDNSTNFASHACVGAGCPFVGDTAWSTDFDPLDAVNGASSSMSYYYNAPVDFTAGGKLAVDIASYDTLTSSASVGVTFAESGGNSEGLSVDLPSGVQQSTPTRLVLDYSGLPVDLSNILFMGVSVSFTGSGGNITVDNLSTVPLPMSAMLFVSGLTLLGELAMRRRS